MMQAKPSKVKVRMPSINSCPNQNNAPVYNLCI